MTFTVEYQVPIVFPGYTYIWADKREVTETGGKFKSHQVFTSLLPPETTIEEV